MCFSLESVCGLSLLKASVYTGWFKCVLAILKAIFYVVVLANKKIVARGALPLLNDFLEELHLEKMTETHLVSALSIFTFVLLGISVLDVIFSLGLIYGTYKGLKNLVTAWLAYEAIFLVLRIIINIIAPFAIFDRKAKFCFVGVLLLCIVFTLNVISFFTWVAVSSFLRRIAFYEFN